eukprot:7749773-Heterocapsa_arctica.AAC.1
MIANSASHVSFQSFAKDYSTRRKALATKKAAMVSSRVQGKAKKVKPQAKLCLPAIGRLEHKDVKQYMPPGAKLWQNRNAGTWHCSVPPLLKHTSRSWSRYGQPEALFLVIREAWKLYCIVQGIEPDDCPMNGVYDSLVVAASAAEAASSSTT